MNMRVQPQRTLAETALIDAYGERQSELPGDGAVMLKRDEAIELVKHGLPTRRVESWHYTDLRRLLNSIPAAFAPASAAKAVEPIVDGSMVLPVLNGVSGAAASKVGGVTVARLSDMLSDGSFAPALELYGHRRRDRRAERRLRRRRLFRRRRRGRVDRKADRTAEHA